MGARAGFFAKSAAVLLLALPAFAAPGGAADPEADARAIVTISGACRTPTHMKYRIVKQGGSTTSTNYSAMPGTTVAFKQAPPKTNCVLIWFATEANAVAGEAMDAAPFLDNGDICQPFENTIVASPFTTAPVYPADRAMIYICKNVLPGDRKVTMQYRSVGGGQVTLGYRTLVVQYTE